MVLLDMDGTLLDLHFDNHFWLEHIPKVYAQKNQLKLDIATEQLMEKFQAYRGQLNWYCLDFWSQELNLNIAELKRDVEHKIAYRPQVLPFLKSLRIHGIPSFIVTNAHRDSIALKMEKTALDNHVDKVISSHDYRAAKESQDFWHRFQAEHQLDLPSTLLIDDSIPVLKAAQAFGIGHLMTILEPDSTMPAREVDQGFTMLDCFSEITLEASASND